MYTVTLDYMDGTKSTVLVPTNSGIIGRIDVADRPGYTFGGWYTDIGYTYIWDTEHDQVQDNMTLYAKWSGWTVIVDFGYYNSSLDPEDRFVQLDLLTDIHSSTSFDKIAFGGRFDTTGTFRIYSDNEQYTEETMSTLQYAQYRLEKAGVNLVFIYWMYYSDFQDMIVNPQAYAEGGNKSAAVYEDTVLSDVAKLLTETVDNNTDYYIDGNGNYHVRLVAYLSNMAARVHMTAYTTDEHGTPVTDLSAMVNPPESFLIFPYNDSSEQAQKIYRMVIEMNGATRDGWSLQGWYIHQDNYDNRIFKGSEISYTAGTNIYLTVKPYEANDEYSTNDYPYVMEYRMGGTLTEVYGITKADYLRLTGHGEVYTIEFYPTWARIPYTITIGTPANGIIYATDDEGNRFTTATMYFGEQFHIRFAANDGYMFHRWASSGEGYFVNAEGETTSFVVQGDTNISAYVIGPQLLRVYIDYGGLDLDEMPDLVISTDGKKADFTFSKTIYDNSRGIVQYLGTANLGDHKLYLVGPTTGKLYDLGMTVKSTTSANLYYVTAEKTLYGRATHTGTDFTEDGIRYVIIDEDAHWVSAEEVTSSSATDITIPVTVTQGAIVYSVASLSSDLIANCTAPEKVTYGSTVIYRNGFIAIVTNEITQGDTSSIAGPGEGIADMTEYLFQYVGNKTYNVNITLEAGHYAYKKEGVTVTDKSGNDVSTTTAEHRFTLTTYTAGNVPDGLTLDGGIFRTDYTVTLDYRFGGSQIKTDSITLEFSDNYLEKLAGKVEITVDTVTYNVYEWKIGNVTIDSTMRCERASTAFTITGNVVAVTAVKMTVDVQKRNDADTGYVVTPGKIYVDATGNAVYRCETYPGYGTPTVTIEGGSMDVSAPIVNITGASASTVLTVTYEWKKVRITVTDADLPAVTGEYHLGEIISLAFPADTPERHYTGWSVEGLTSEVVDNSYIVTEGDVDLYYESHPEFSITYTYETKLYEVSIVTMRGTMTKDAVDVGTLQILHVPYNTAVTSSGSSVTIGAHKVDGESVAAQTFTIDATSEQGHYTFRQWNISAATDGKVPGDITLTAVWDVATFPLTLTVDGHVVASATNSGRSVEFVDNVANINYNTLVRISIVFDPSFTLDPDNSHFRVDGNDDPSLVPEKQGSIQEYVLQFFMTDDTVVNLVSLEIRNEIRFLYTVDGHAPVIVPALTMVVGDYSTSYLQISAYEYAVEALSGYYFDGWYLDRGCTQAIPMRGITEDQVTTWYYEVYVEKESINLYGRMVPVNVYNYENVYDGTEHEVRVTTAEFVNTNITIDYTYGTPEAHCSDVSITYCDEQIGGGDKSGTHFTYRAVFQKFYPVVDPQYSGAEKVFEGDFTLSLTPRKLTVIANSMIVNEASEIGDGYKSCTLLGIAADEHGNNYDEVTPEYTLTSGTATVTPGDGTYTVSGRGYVNIGISRIAITDADDSHIDRSANYTHQEYGGQILILRNSTTVIVVR
jgi:uncharacterized repeat protein (TIGR02543 family)